ncbi:hypothetical protein [Bradyrhizobium japonicum]|uniref:hypothetical protein n=1 Tax=Bradyrhizobium japonicum TaxID=375 RepID=UPI003B66D614
MAESIKEGWLAMAVSADPSPDLEPVHCRAICREIGERLQLYLKPDVPISRRLELLLRRIEETAL